MRGSSAGHSETTCFWPGKAMRNSCGISRGREGLLRRTFGTSAQGYLGSGGSRSTSCASIPVHVGVPVLVRRCWLASAMKDSGALVRGALGHEHCVASCPSGVPLSSLRRTSECGIGAPSLGAVCLEAAREELKRGLRAGPEVHRVLAKKKFRELNAKKIRPPPPVSRKRGRPSTDEPSLSVAGVSFFGVWCWSLCRWCAS